MGRNFVLKTRCLYLAWLALSTSAAAQSDEELRHEMQLTVSKAYSECAAYFELAQASKLKNHYKPNNLSMPILPKQKRHFRKAVCHV